MSPAEASAIALGTFILVHLVVCCGAGVTLRNIGQEKRYESERAKVSLTCRSRDIVVHLDFSEPFRGIVHAGEKDSACSLRGDGKKSYTLSVPFESCGTIRRTHPRDSFTNTLTIRYHPALELEGDEIKTIICNYGNTGSLQVG